MNANQFPSSKTRPMKTAARLSALCCFLLFAQSDLTSFLRAAETPDRTLLFPKLTLGQSVAYDIGYRSATTTNTESNVEAPMVPPGGQTEAHLLLQVETVSLSSDGGKPSAHLRTQISNADTLPEAAASSSVAARNLSKPARIVEFTLHANGQVTDLVGLDALSPDERAVWQVWVARFGVGAALPEKGVKPGDKWRNEEPVTQALLTGLSWEKESQYVDDEPCPVASAARPSVPTAAPSSESCAVILTIAILKQKSPPKDATPDDYKLHDLRTSGVAKGKNELITYISRNTGLVVRATEDANQSLNVIVAKSDGSNRVHYTIDAQSHTQLLLLSSTSPQNRP